MDTSCQFGERFYSSIVAETDATLATDVQIWQDLAMGDLGVLMPNVGTSPL